MSMIRATPAHGAVMAAMHCLCFDPAECWSAEAFTTQLELAGVFGLIWEEAGLILARTAADEAEILTLGVVPRARRMGVGRQLLHGAEILAHEAGAITMFLEVSYQNPGAAALYQRAGYSLAGRRKRYYADGSDALVLRKILG